MKRFVEIKKTTQAVLAETIDFSKYRDEIQKILDKYVTAMDVEMLSKPINLSDINEFNQYVMDQKNGLSDKSKAEAIAAQTSKVITERYHQDPIFYANFKDRVDELLAQLREAKREDLKQLFENAKTFKRRCSKGRGFRYSGISAG